MVRDEIVRNRSWPRRPRIDGISFLTFDAACQKLGVRPDQWGWVGWPETFSLCGHVGFPLPNPDLCFESDVLEVLARPDFGRPYGQGFVGGDFEEDGPRLFMIKDFEPKALKRARRISPNGLLKLINRTMECCVQLMRPYYPDAEALTVGLVFTIADISFHDSRVLYTPVPKDGWWESHVPGCWINCNPELWLTHVRIKKRIDCVPWLDPDPMKARWVAIREMGDLIDRTMLAVAKHFSTTPENDGVGLKALVHGPDMPGITGWNETRVISSWIR